MTETPDLPLSAIRAIVSEAEAEILQILERVRERTDVAVANIHLDTITAWHAGERRPSIVPSRVTLEMEEI